VPAHPMKLAARALARASCGACLLLRRAYEQPLVAPQEEQT
jgi:hypothetical protein